MRRGTEVFLARVSSIFFHPPSLPLVQVRTFALEEMEFSRSKWLSVSFTTNRNFMSYYDPWNIYQTKPSVNAETTSNPLGRQVHSPDSPLSIVTAQCPPEKIIVVGSTKHSTHKTTTSHTWHQVHLEKWFSNLSMHQKDLVGLSRHRFLLPIPPLPLGSLIQ